MGLEVRGNPGRNVSKLLKQYQSSLEVAITEIVLEVERTAKQTLTDIGKVDRGFLRNSIDHRIENVNGNTEGVVFVGAKHGVWVEFGRRGTSKSPKGMNKDSAKAAFPPIDVIQDWVKRNNAKLAVSGRTKSGKARKAKQVDIESVAFLIARKIAEEGIEPSPFLIPAFLKVQPKFRLRLVTAIRNVRLRP